VAYRDEVLADSPALYWRLGETAGTVDYVGAKVNLAPNHSVGATSGGVTVPTTLLTFSNIGTTVPSVPVISLSVN